MFLARFKWIHTLKELTMAVNVELLQKTLDTIEQLPQHWNQSFWHCGTSHCFGGFAELIANNIPIETSHDEIERLRIARKLGVRTSIEAERLLGISVEDADVLFYGYNTLELLERMVAHLIEYDSLKDFEEYFVDN